MFCDVNNAFFNTKLTKMILMSRSSVLRTKLNILISIMCQWRKAMFTFKSSFSPKILSFPVEVHF